MSNSVTKGWWCSSWIEDENFYSQGDVCETSPPPHSHTHHHTSAKRLASPQLLTASKGLRTMFQASIVSTARVINELAGHHRLHQISVSHLALGEPGRGIKPWKRLPYRQLWTPAAASAFHHDMTLYKLFFLSPLLMSEAREGINGKGQSNYTKHGESGIFYK